MYNTLS